MRWTFIILFMFSGIMCAGQGSMELKIGNKLENYQLQNLLNYTPKSANISDFKGKLVILDFWNMYCTACIAGFREIGEMQELFKDKIQVILVNVKDSEADIRKVFATRKKVTNKAISIPTLYGDTILAQLFKVPSFPHIVWLDKEGYIRSISGGGSITALNIENALRGDYSAHPVKNNPGLLDEGAINHFNEMIEDSNLLDAKVFIDQPYGFIKDARVIKKGDYFIINGINTSLMDLYRLAYKNRKSDYYGEHIASRRRLIVEIKDSAKRSLLNDEARYTYRFMSKHKDVQGMLEEMQNDLIQAFQIKGHWENRLVDCLVFSSSDTSKIIYKEGLHKSMITESYFDVNGIPMDVLISTWVNISNDFDYITFPIVNETGIQESSLLRSIKFEGDIYDMNFMSKKLKKYGLCLSLEKRNLDMLILD